MRKYLLPLFTFLFFSVNALPQSGVVQQILNASNLDSLIHFVKELSGEVQTNVNGSPVTIVSRHKLQPGNDLAETYIKQKLESYGLTTTIQSFSATGKNVIGAQTGTVYPNQKFMICAHFDDMPSGSTAPGADDNASGTAAVIEAARLLSQYSFPYTILYALWDEEEQGLVGSNYYATQAAAAGDSIIGVINLDMIAWDSNNDGKMNIHTANVGITMDIFARMVDVNSQYNINLDIIEIFPHQPYSDHHSFLIKGYAAVLLIEASGDFNAYYHTVNDKVQYFNQSYFHKMTKLAIGALAEFAMNLNLQIIHTPIASTSTSNNIETSIQVFSGLEIGTGISGPRLYYRFDNGSGFGNFTSIEGTPAGSSTFNFTIPALPLGSLVQYYIAVQDDNSSMVKTLPAGGSGFNPPGNIPPAEFFQFYVGPLSYALIDNATNLNNWTYTGAWGLTTLKYTSPPSSFTDSPIGNYSANVTSNFTYNGTIDLTNALGGFIEFETQWAIEDNWDYGMVQVSTNNGSTWVALEGNYTNPGQGTFQPNGQPLYDGTQLSWVHEVMDISAYAGQQLKLRFYFRSDGNIQADGWYIDDLIITLFESVPVELISFIANVTDNSVTLNWVTASEVNNNRFEIERRSDNSAEWETTGFVKGSGTTTETSTYVFTDNNPLFGTSWYRLKQVDFNGTSEYHGPVKVENNTILTFKMWQNYPNPFNPVTFIKYAVPEENLVTLKVYDVLGNEIAVLVNERKAPGFYTVGFSGSALSSGTYIYRLKAGETIINRKMVLVK